MFDAGKTRMNGLPYSEKSVTIKSFSSDTGTSRTDRRTTDEQSCYINIARQCDKNIPLTEIADTHADVTAIIAVTVINIMEVL